MTDFTVWDGSEELGVAFGLGPTESEVRVGMVPGGARSVAELFQGEENPDVLAHRLGSLDWSEFSARGATESVLREVEALEISVNRSSDGVWFGLHDETLLRTSGVDLDPFTMTWHEIQNYPNLAPVGGDPAFGDQPYARLTDILEAYATSHVIFLDPKYRTAEPYRSELFDLVESVVPNAQEHIVIKWSGGAINLADYATSRGYTSWGYFYEEEYLADPVGVMANAAHWTYLGLNVSALQSTWNVFLATGKPVIAHTAATQAAYDMSKTKGASCVMCSGIRAIKGDAVI